MRPSRWQRPIFGPFRRQAHTGVPADHFRPAAEMTAYGDGVNVLVAHGEHSLASLVAAASGGTDWPIADRDTAWDGAAAAKDCQKWASSDGSGDKDKIDFTKLGRCFFWKDDSDGDPSNLGDFKLGFVANDGGTMKAIPKGIFAVGGVLSGARGGADLGGDETAVKAKVAAWYRKLAAKFDDPSIKAPWLPDKESSAKSRILAAVDVLPGFQASEAATSLIVAIDAAVDELMEELGIGDDDGEDQMSAAAAVALRRAQLALAKAEMGPDPLASVHPPFTGRHSHPHSAFGQQGGDATHSHSHSHNGDATHVHAHGAMAELPERSGPSLHNLSIEERRRVDGSNEITDPAELAALVASAFEARGGIEAWSALRASLGLTAATGADGKVVPAAWHGYDAVEGIRTDDGRELCAEACLFPDLPVSIRLLLEDQGGHWGAVTAGRVDTMERVPLGPISAIYSEGMFGSDPNGQLAELMVAEQTQRFLSIDPRPDFVGEVVSVTISTGDGDGYFGELDDVAVDTWLRIQSCTIGAVTIVPIPAYPQCVITLADQALPEAPIAIASAPPGLPAVTAAGGPVRPSRKAFDNPGFYVGDPRLVRQKSGDYACPATVSEDGSRCWGHLAAWKTAHTAGVRDEYGQPRKPPRSKTNYAYFLTGVVVCEDGSEVPVGNLTMGTGHASVYAPLPDVLAHYDGGYGAVCVADVTVGEDDFGIWFAGAMRSELTDEQLREFRATNLSGDWRNLGGNLELVAVLAGVPSPGFPIARRAVTAAGTPVFADGEAMIAAMNGDRCLALVAAGVVQRIDPLERLAALERAHEILWADYQSLAARVRPIELERLRAQSGL